MAQKINIIWHLRDVEVDDLSELYNIPLTLQLKQDLQVLSERLAYAWINMAQDYLNKQDNLTYEQKLQVMENWKKSLIEVNKLCI